MSTIKVDTIATRTGSGNITLSNSLASATVAGDLTVDTNTLHVDAANNRVGIGTTSPGAILQVDRASANFIRFADSGSLTGLIGLDDGATLVSGGTDGDMVIRAETSGKGVVFAGNGATRFGMIDADGLKFNTDTAAANALDDYEEGTWTPTYTSSSTDPTFTPNLQDGLYTKIGRVVYASFRLRGAISGTKTGNLRLSGLPFTSNSSSANGSGGIGLTEAFGADNYPTNLRVNQISTYINLQVYDSADPRDGLFTNVTVTSTSGSSSGNYIIGHVVYQTD